MNLSTKYLGLDLKHPLVASASPQSKNVDGVKKLADAGASAIVLFSLFEEQIRHEREAIEFLIGRSTYNHPESLSFFPPQEDFNVGPGEYLDLIYDASRAIDVPLIASLNGVTELGWIEYAKDMVQAGAKALELNIFLLPTDVHLSGAEVEEQYVRIVSSVKEAVHVPIAVKLSPFFSSIGNMASRLAKAGADGVVLFNRFYQPDFDIENRIVESRLELSRASEIRLPLLCISVLHGLLPCSLAASTGVESANEVVKYVMAGADAVMTTSALLRNGENYLRKLITDFTQWMAEHEFESVAQMKGSMSYRNCAEPEAMVRANYLRMLQSFKPEHTRA